MRRIDEIHLKWPFYGARKLCEALRAEGTTVNRKRMKRMMGLESVAPKPDTSEPHPEHPVQRRLVTELAAVCSNAQLAAAPSSVVIDVLDSERPPCPS
jgi:putative transposase